VVFDLPPLALVFFGQARYILVTELDQELVCGLIASLFGHNAGIQTPAIP
jgi:hypothetical protein